MLGVLCLNGFLDHIYLLYTCGMLLQKQTQQGKVQCKMKATKGKWSSTIAALYND